VSQIQIRPELSVVVPVYGCRDCLRALHKRLDNASAAIPGAVEFIFVDDRGQDEAWEVLCDLARADSRVSAYRLSKNYGQHAAITAGIAQASGNWILVMDCDLQDPPEDIPRLYARAQEGYDIVLARRHRRSDSVHRRLLSRLYFKLLNVFSGSSLDGEFGTFSVISRKVADAYLRFRDHDRHYLFILNWLGFERGSIEYHPAARAAGRSGYSFRKLVAHALDGLFFQTTVLLRWIVYLGFGLALAGGAAAVYVAVARITGTAYPGWASLVVLQLLLGGFIIASTGVTGLYIGRVFDQVRERPLFVIDESVGAHARGRQPEPVRLNVGNL
jgi:polyisoprenyl-phosphate glycosyltransferase